MDSKLFHSAFAKKGKVGFRLTAETATLSVAHAALAQMRQDGDYPVMHPRRHFERKQDWLHL